MARIGEPYIVINRGNSFQFTSCRHWIRRSQHRTSQFATFSGFIIWNKGCISQVYTGLTRVFGFENYERVPT